MSLSQHIQRQKVLSLIFVETELELIPPSILHHPQVTTYAEKRGKPARQLLLDATYHHNAMKKLSDSKRRGRPDIIHRCLLLALDSWANYQGLLRIYIHTRNDDIISIDPRVRLPKHYHRFLGLLEQLFAQKTISSDTITFLSLKHQPLKSFLNTLSAPTFLLSEQGIPTHLIDFFHASASHHLILGIGTFPHGNFQNAHRYFDECLNIAPLSYSASTITAKTLFSFEEACEHRQQKSTTASGN